MAPKPLVLETTSVAYVLAYVRNGVQVRVSVETLVETKFPG
jgi:hypothetical protein